jgi:ribonuclease HI
MNTIEIWTDGGCRPTNPGYGAYSFVVTDKSNSIIHESAHFCGESTNNIMEITASIKALEWCKNNGHKENIIFLYTDSQYVQQGITSWIHKWKQRKWKTGNKKPVANQDLWKKLDKLKGELNVHFQWIRGHKGMVGNERADQLCTETLELHIKKIEDDKSESEDR